MSKKDANVSWKALIIQVDSLSVMLKSSMSDGMAENRAELLNASRNWARQKMKRRTYFLAAE